MRLRVHCPAKINLFLAVGPLDERGYHPIRTVYQAVGLFDCLHIERASSEDQIICEGFDLPVENTLTKALRLVRELIAVPPLKIVLEKNIPAEAGLGGGSSDAAGVLRALRYFVAPPPDETFLKDVAAAVGKDVPFFLVGGRAKGEGYGEMLMSLPDPEIVWYVIVLPEGAAGSTKEAYARLDRIQFPFAALPVEGALYNDFERVASCESLEYLDTLGAYGASGALLTGSGAAVFGVFENENLARQAVHRLAQDSRIKTWLAPSLSHSDSLRIEVVE